MIGLGRAIVDRMGRAGSLRLSQQVLLLASLLPPKRLIPVKSSLLMKRLTPSNSNIRFNLLSGVGKNTSCARGSFSNKIEAAVYSYALSTPP